MGTFLVFIIILNISLKKKSIIFDYWIVCWLIVVWLISSDEKEEEEYEKEEVGEDGEIILVSGDKVSGPWNKSGAPPPPAAPVGG